MALRTSKPPSVELILAFEFRRGLTRFVHHIQTFVLKKTHCFNAKWANQRALVDAQPDDVLLLR